MNVDSTLAHLLTALAGVLVALSLWRACARRARRAANTARPSTQLLFLAGRLVVGAGLLSGVQWLALTYPGAHWSVRAAALGVPALFASYTLTRAFTVVTVDSRRRGGGHR